MKAHSKETQGAMTPQSALKALKDGNQRFLNSTPVNRDLLGQVSDTQSGQYPYAIVLSCVDSRVPAEIVFDQGIGDIFSARVAGNSVNEDILGSMEYACKVAGSKLIVVLGHTSCGAVSAACDDVMLGNITTLLAKIRPSVAAVKKPTDPAERTSANKVFVNKVVEKNVELAIQNIHLHSAILKEMHENGEIDIVGGVYSVADGSVSFMN
jgi:carbonic anhydrase